MCCWNADIYFLLLLIQVDFLGSTFYFLESRKFLNYFYILQSIYFWQHWLFMHLLIVVKTRIICTLEAVSSTTFLRQNIWSKNILEPV